MNWGQTIFDRIYKELLHENNKFLSEHFYFYTLHILASSLMTFVLSIKILDDWKEFVVACRNKCSYEKLLSLDVNAYLW